MMQKKDLSYQGFKPINWQFWAISGLILLIIQPAWAEVKEQGSGEVDQCINRCAKSPSTNAPTHPISRVRDLKRPATTVKDWLAQVEAATVQVTGVKLECTDAGLEITLETAEGKPLQVDATKFRSVGNNLTADIPNAVLALPDAQGFSADNPTGDIANVQVTQLNANNIRVSVAGRGALPTTEVTLKTAGLAYSLNPKGETPEEELVVTGERNGYRVPNASTATRTDTPLRDIPASIQVVPRQVLEDQRAVRLQDAVQNVSGVTQGANYGGLNAGNYIIRGFNQDGNFRNGFRDSNLFAQLDIANVERVEVLKGPASVLFGQAQPGGIINLVTKQPLSEPYYAAEFTAGSYSFYRPTLDFSGPLNSDKTLLYRLNVAYQNSGSFRDFVGAERSFIAPALTWKIGTNTTLNVDFEYLNSDASFDRGVVAIGNKPAPIPISRFLGFPSANDAQDTVYRGGYRLEHRFSENWQIRNALSITSYKTRDLYTNPDELIDNQFLTSSLTDNNFGTDEYSLQTEVTGKVATGSLTHQILIGTELNRTSTFFNSRGADLPSIDIFNPAYNIATPPALEVANRSQTRVDRVGVYLQDQITLLANLKLLVGGRFDFTDQKNINLLTSTSTSQSDQAFSPRVGIVYQPIPPVSLYASYSRSFFPVIGNAADDSAFVPQRGTQYEVGIKTDLSARVSATLAAYEVTKTNVSTTDPNNTDFSIQVGEQRSRGVELDVAGEILPGWKIIASYAHTNAEITEDNRFPVGNLLNNVAKNTASLWTTYEVQQGNLQGLGFGLGLFYVGDRQGDLNNTFVLLSYFRTDAAIYYRRSKWKLALNIKNLFDKKYYETSQARSIIYPGAPLTVLGTISVEF